MAKLNFFDQLVGEGLEPIALRPDTKIPILKNWNKDWSLENRELIRRADTNIGIRLGKIIDVEGDSPKANEKIFSLVEDYPHPIYQSRKSFHHFFINPEPELNILTFDDIEFRANNHQSVVPPSIVNGVQYQWVKQVWPIPQMPEKLLRFFYEIQRLKKRKKCSVKQGHMQPYCGICGKREFIHKERHRLELMAFHELKSEAVWECHKCRTVDIRDRVKEIRKVVERNANISDWRDWLRWVESSKSIGKPRT